MFKDSDNFKPLIGQTVKIRGLVSRKKIAIFNFNVQEKFKYTGQTNSSHHFLNEAKGLHISMRKFYWKDS